MMIRRVSATVFAFASLALAHSLVAQGLVLVSPEDYEAIPVAALPQGFADALPASHDLSAHMPPAGSQGAQGSCVAWAVGFGLKTYQEAVELGVSPKRPEQVFSPAYIHNQLVAGRSGGCNRGTSIPAALNLLKEQGAATLADFPYDASTCDRLPTLRARSDAERWRIADWGRVELEHRSVKGHLAAGRPLVISMCVGDEFHRHGSGVFRGDAGEVVTVNANGWPTCRFGHAMLVTGYDDGLGAYRILNSWGDDWGDEGYAWLSYGAFDRQVRGAYVAWDEPTWTEDERMGQLAREAAAAARRAEAAEARADSAEARLRDVERRLGNVEDRFAEHLRRDSTAAALRRAASRDDHPRSTTYEEHVRVGAPRLMADRVTVIRLGVDESGWLESLGEEDVKAYLHRIPCGPRLRLSLGDREAFTDDYTELGLEHLRDRESSHIDYSDDDGRSWNFRFDVTRDACYLLVAEGYDDEETGPYTLSAQAGRVRYTFTTYGPAGWSDFTPWAGLPRQR